MGNSALAVTDSTFEAEVLSSAIPVLVDFWAEWCGPCKRVAPVIDEIAAEYAGRLKVVKVDVESNPQTSGQYQVRSIPTFVIIQGGELVKHMVGFGNDPKAQLKNEIDEVLKG